MAFTFSVGDTLSATVSYVDDMGNPAVVDGPTTWTSSDPAIASVSDDGTTVTVVCHAVGACQIKSSADADLGSGVRELIGTADLTVVAKEAVAATINLAKA